METETAVNLGREGLKLALELGGPILLVGVVVGFLVALLQAATQIQDQTLGTVLKIVSTFAAIAIFLPWSIAKIVEFSRNLFEKIPETTTFFWN